MPWNEAALPALGLLCDRFVEIFADKPRLHALGGRFRIGGRPRA